MSKSAELVSLDAVESPSTAEKVEVTHDLSKDAPSASDFSMTATWSQMFSCATGLDYVLMFFGTVG